MAEGMRLLLKLLLHCMYGMARVLTHYIYIYIYIYSIYYNQLLNGQDSANEVVYRDCLDSSQTSVLHFEQQVGGKPHGNLMSNEKDWMAYLSSLPTRPPARVYGAVVLEGGMGLFVVKNRAHSLMLVSPHFPPLALSNIWASV